LRSFLKPGAILADTQLGGTWEVGDKVEMNPKFSHLPVFHYRMPKPIRGRPIVSTLGNIGEFIETGILPMFEKFL
jgi:hypothetical protein